MKVVTCPSSTVLVFSTLFRMYTENSLTGLFANLHASTCIHIYRMMLLILLSVHKTHYTFTLYLFYYLTHLLRTHVTIHGFITHCYALAVDSVTFCLDLYLDGPNDPHYQTITYYSYTFTVCFKIRFCVLS